MIITTWWPPWQIFITIIRHPDHETLPSPSIVPPVITILSSIVTAHAWVKDYFLSEVYKKFKKKIKYYFVSWTCQTCLHTPCLFRWTENCLWIFKESAKSIVSSQTFKKKVFILIRQPLTFSTFTPWKTHSLSLSTQLSLSTLLLRFLPVGLDFVSDGVVIAVIPCAATHHPEFPPEKCVLSSQ